MGSIDKACITGFLCRLCSEMHRMVIHIYGDQGRRLCLVEKINGYLPITISPTDPLPKTICTTCLRRIEQHYELLMRLSIIRKERLRRNISSFNTKRKQLDCSLVSSNENSEDEVRQGDETPHRNDDDHNGPSRSDITIAAADERIGVLNRTNTDDPSISPTSAHSLSSENESMSL